MNTNDFEKRLQRQTLRRVPAEWREEILSAAHSAAPSHHVSRFTFHDLLSTLNSQLSTFLSRRPKAWAALGAAWLAILAMNLYTADNATEVTGNVAPPSPEMIVVLREQRRELARLVEPATFTDADKPKPLPSGPRSGLRFEILAA